MSYDHCRGPPHIWNNVIGQFASGHWQTIEIKVHRAFFAGSIYVVNELFSPFSFFMGFPMHCLLCERRSPSNGQFFLSMYRKCAPSVVNIFVRGVVLFILGAFLAIVLFVLSVLPEARRRQIEALDFEIIANLFSTVWWIAPSCGTAAAVVGLVYPCSDIRLGRPHKLKREWSSVTRCVVLFLGISHACAVSFQLFVFIV